MAYRLLLVVVVAGQLLKAGVTAPGPIGDGSTVEAGAIIDGFMGAVLGAFFRGALFFTLVVVLVLVLSALRLRGAARWAAFPFFAFFAFRFFAMIVLPMVVVPTMRKSPRDMSPQ